MTDIASTDTEKNERGRGSLLLLTGVFLLGVCIGTAVLASGGSSFPADRLDAALEDYVSARTNFGTTFMNTFLSGMLFVTACFLLGTSIISQPLLVLVPFLKGVGHGAVMALLYSRGDGGGVLISLVVILPAAAVTSLAVILAAREAIGMSCRLLATALGGSGCAESIKIYLARFLVLTLMTAAAAGIDGAAAILLTALS